MLWRRDIHAEQSGAEDLRYQEAYDESDGLMPQFRPKSAEAEAAAAQAKAEAAAAESESESESEVDETRDASVAAARLSSTSCCAGASVLNPDGTYASAGSAPSDSAGSSGLSPRSPSGWSTARRHGLSMSPSPSKSPSGGTMAARRSSLPSKKWRGLVLDTQLASQIRGRRCSATDSSEVGVGSKACGPTQGPATASSADPERLAGTVAGQGAAAGSAADVSAGALAAALRSPGGERGGSCESAESVAETVAPKIDEGVDDSDDYEEDEGEAAEDAEPSQPQVLSQRWNNLRWNVLALVRASQPRPAGEGQGGPSIRELV